ncbi:MULTISPECIES: 2Fe-2S iron-sulfur cluster-binding protein [Pseudomonas]|uniref:2Fe-2S iron-sulfur cluster-binding protein n=1 Tax=Pseudomonas TaxID=286 RepID=UPI001239F79B|nr:MULTISPECIES: 2Fe-2S iron-sulfur cluster-binding protein [Pseudomonas]QIB51476.1 2Fe-2S iron-sulfur cluster binding domain-containing protein [Pseudomonas sp. OIL-1]
MPTITLIEHNGTQHSVMGEVGQSVMQAAMNAMVPGIQADCGGACSCATCHAFVEDAWTGVVPAAEDAELDMLEFANERQETSRLTCQLTIQENMDGMVLRLPESQY